MKKWETFIATLIFALPLCLCAEDKPKHNYFNTKTSNCEYKPEREWIMPKRDGTGPLGMGPKTGCGVGYCNEVAIGENYQPNKNRPRWGMRLRRTRQNGKFCERGFGRYNVDTLPLDLEEQRQFLEQELQLLQRQQEATRIRLERLKEVSTNQR